MSSEMSELRRRGAGGDHERESAGDKVSLTWSLFYLSPGMQPERKVGVLGVSHPASQLFFLDM